MANHVCFFARVSVRAAPAHASQSGQEGKEAAIQGGAPWPRRRDMSMPMSMPKSMFMFAQHEVTPKL